METFIDTEVTDHNRGGYNNNDYILTKEDSDEMNNNPQKNEHIPHIMRTPDDNFQTCIQQTCGYIVNHANFQSVIIAFITINSITMGIATFDFVTENNILNSIFEGIDKTFLIIFTVELCMQFVYRGFGLFNDAWLIFDFVIIALSWMSAGLQVIRSFRILRASRLIMRVQSMKEIVEALIKVQPRISAIACLLFLIFYIYAVMMTTLFKPLYDDGYLEEDYFGRLDKSFFTLFQLMTLDSWSYITKQCTEVYPWAWVPFVTFVTISSFTVINLVIAVICDAVADLQNSRVEEHLKQSESNISERNETTIKHLENSIEELKALVEQLVAKQELNEQ